MRETSGLATESVWDYPRPPRIEPDGRRILVKSGATVIADSTDTMRVLETSHPPVFYIPRPDVDMTLLALGSRHTFCEYKGRASYLDLVEPTVVPEVAWFYPEPSPGYEAIANMIAFYPAKVECYVDQDRVIAQDGGFYGGWITSEIAGPFKGGPGTRGW